MITYSDSTLFDVGAYYVVNPVNCVGKMGKGVALWFKDSFPDMFASYENLCDFGLLCPGRLHLYKVGGLDLVIVNLPTKTHYRKPSLIEYVELGVKTLAEHALWSDTIAMPMIGCGTGGLRWTNDVLPIIEKYLKRHNVVVCSGMLNKRVYYNSSMHSDSWIDFGNSKAW